MNLYKCIEKTTKLNNLGSPQKLGRPVHQNTFTSNSGHIQEGTQPQNKQVASFTWDMALF